MTRNELEKYLLTMAGSGRVANSILLDGAVCAEDRAVAERFVARLMGTVDHPDVIRIEHEKPNLISASELRRQVCDNVVLKPYAKPYKIYLLEMDLINVQGQNILLKTLEEPPEYAIFILLSSAADMLLETIRSRCLILKIGEGERSEDLPEETVKQIADIAEALPFSDMAGGIRLANEIVQISDSEKATFDEIFGIINKIYRDALVECGRGGKGRLAQLGEKKLLSMLDAVRAACGRVAAGVNKNLALNDMAYLLREK
ncbi:MAG: hypothetical protein IJS22_09155 [Lachnospiraceae bacterium]|nr:hypothetical protein [Lachnospiraceae bacterium]